MSNIVTRCPRCGMAQENCAASFCEACGAGIDQPVESSSSSATRTQSLAEDEAGGGEIDRVDVGKILAEEVKDSEIPALEIDKETSHSSCSDLDVSYNVSRIFIEGSILPFEFRICPRVDGITDVCVELDTKGVPRLSEVLEEYLERENEYETYISFAPPRGCHGLVPFRIYIGYKKNGEDYWFLAHRKHKIYRADQPAETVIENLKIELNANIDGGQASDGIQQRLEGLDALAPKAKDPAAELQNVDLPPDWRSLALKKCKHQHEIGNALGIIELPSPPSTSLDWRMTLRSRNNDLLHVISRPTIQFGRNRKCEIVTRIMDQDGEADGQSNEKLSKFHCHIENRGSDCSLVDIGYDSEKQTRKPSACGTFLNGRRIPSGQSVPLAIDTEFRLSLAGVDSTDPQVLVFCGRVWTCRSQGKCASPIHDNCTPDEPACMTLRRMDGAPETFLVLWKSSSLRMLEDELCGNFGHLRIFRHEGAFAYVMHDNQQDCGWLVPGQNVNGLEIKEYEQFGKWAKR